MSYECCGDGHAAGDAFLASLGTALGPISEFYKILLELSREYWPFSDTLDQPVLIVFLLACLLVIVVIVSCFHASSRSRLAGDYAGHQRDWLVCDRSRAADSRRGDEDATSSATDDFAGSVEQKRQ